LAVLICGAGDAGCLLVICNDVINNLLSRQPSRRVGFGTRALAVQLRPKPLDAPNNN
jgi:hypothetical protein